MDGVLQQAVAVGVVHGNRRRRPLKNLADLFENPAYGHAQFVVLNRVDKVLEFSPKFAGGFGRDLDQVVDQSRGAEFLIGERRHLE